jgi:hypothetical protein
MDVRDSVLKYMATHNTMTISTIGEGSAQSAALFYVNDEFTLYFLSDPESRHSRNIARNSSVSVTINEDYRDWRKIRGIQLEGEAVMVKSPLENAKAFKIYIYKFPYVEGFFKSPVDLFKGVKERALKTRFYKIIPNWIRFIDNEREFGYKEEFTL